jgi:UDP-N-acetylglucosamine 2-epimerase (non-hydrolysing)
LLRLQAATDLHLLERMDYPDFVSLLVGSCFLMTDGGSNQEEAAMMGLPTLLLRRATERIDGLQDVVVLSHLRPQIIRQFVATYAGKQWELRQPSGHSPSAFIARVLQDDSRAPCRRRFSAR